MILLTSNELHAACYFCCFRSYGQFLNVHPGSYFWWLRWQHCVGLTGVCVLVVSQGMMYWMKCPLISLLRILRHCPEVVVYP